MKTKITFIIFICLFISCLFASLFANVIQIYPSFNRMPAEEQVLYNDIFEVEPEPVDMPITYIVVEKLNWFNTVNTLFVKFSVVRVIDCYTGKEYFVKRTGGYNHADVEPLTKTDTSIFKSIYDNVWSWNRRPVWVEINGLFVAGSINGMPHSYEYITDNNMNGHSCIHFYMSRTHGTNNLDPNHQSCVDYAYNNSDALNQLFWSGKIAR